ncbi:uncharacterized protein LTR77_000759 [Saxophila tyrrhenica]|uniref:Uncharacterized protein n=1 Tax=Saxophila tyrrhenica TaxID=1690608 RepID=A0AAV9PQ69_9PEZI|nr:hypothetical protein LTR77_000759 [Saxophila tyrrhenica]
MAASSKKNTRQNFDSNGAIGNSTSTDSEQRHLLLHAQTRTQQPQAMSYDELLHHDDVWKTEVEATTAHHTPSTTTPDPNQALVQAVARQLAILPRDQWYLTHVPSAFLREAKRVAEGANIFIHWYWWPWPADEQPKEKPLGSNGWQRREIDLLWELMGEYEKWTMAKRGEGVDLDVDVSGDEVLVKWDDTRYCDI